MKRPRVPLQLGLTVLLCGLSVSAVSLSLSPSRDVFFRRESVSLRCVDGGQTADGWTVMRTTGGRTQTCDGGRQGDFGRLDGSSCVVASLFPSDSGAYWCEGGAGRRSDPVPIRVSNRTVVLELPDRPAVTGSDVTLRCRTRDGLPQTAFFFFNGTFVGTRPGEFTIRDVQRAHEGPYRCSTGLLETSLQRWLRVRDSDLHPHPHPPPPSLSVMRLVCHLVAICPYVISTVLMLSVCCSKRTGHKSVVSMAMDHSVEGNHCISD